MLDTLEKQMHVLFFYAMKVTSLSGKTGAVPLIHKLANSYERKLLEAPLMRKLPNFSSNGGQ